MDLLRPALRQKVRFPIDDAPMLMISIDAEEEFDWHAPFQRGRYSVRAMQHQWRAQAIFEAAGLVPTYSIDYPVATEPESIERLLELKRTGRCIIGSHLHPWVNPPHEEEISESASFPGNLAPRLERRKLAILTETIEANFGVKPTIYKAGRYGIGPATAGILEDLGYRIDMSVIPMRNYAPFGGPNFTYASSVPYWFGSRGDMLEIPHTAGLTGSLRFAGAKFSRIINSPLSVRAHLPGLLARSQLLNRIYITPEGMPLEEAKAVTRSLIGDGMRVISLSYHSTSLAPGHTPYVRSSSDLDRFLYWLEAYIDFFMGELRGRPTTPLTIYDRAAELRAARAQSAVEPGGAPSRAAPATLAPPKCLIVASNFPPVRGGSAVVYGNLCRFGHGAFVALSAMRNYTTGAEIQDWEEHDTRADFPVTRVDLLRPPLARAQNSVRGNSFLFVDLPLMARVFATVARLIRQHDINVLCVGELVYNGWLAFACRYLLRCKVILYIHGEEITAGGKNRAERMKRSYLAAADAVVAVSCFTRQVLIDEMGVAPERIELIENGVDLMRFREIPRSAPLIARYRLADKRIILSVGRLVPRKGFDQVLRALPEICARHPDAHYLIVGDGPYRAALEQLAREAGVEHRVTFAGDVPDLELVDHYSISDIFVLPNREMPDGDTEGFGLVFLEANACGKPVVSGRAGGAADAVTDGVNGLSVDGTDTAQIADAVSRLLEDGALRSRLRAGGLQIAQASGWQDRTDRFLALCARLIAPAR
ncbi:MAG: glycosyltransferase [Alphaproteobacteria bacterium]|nr:glycosyltransferase [Alphaproteobacteria bacterium]